MSASRIQVRPGTGHLLCKVKLRKTAVRENTDQREALGEGRPGSSGEAPDRCLDGFAILWTLSQDRLPG